MLSVLGQMYSVIVLSIIIDLFLKIRLNVKYGLYLSAKRTRSMLLGLTHSSKFDIFHLFGGCCCL